MSDELYIKLAAADERDDVMGVTFDTDGWRDYLMPATQCCSTARDSFRTLWSTLYAKPGERWEDNPFVVALTFRVERRNIDAPDGGEG